MKKLSVKIRWEYDDGEKYHNGYDLVDTPLVYDEDGDFLTYGHFWNKKIALLVAKFLSKKLAS